MSIKSSPPPPVRTCDDKLPSSTDTALEWCQPKDLAKLLPPLPTLPNVANNTAKYGKICKIQYNVIYGSLLLNVVLVANISEPVVKAK